MAKKDMKTALGKSLKDEGAAVEKRFKNAEAAFGKRYTEATVGHEVERKSRVIRDSFTMPDYDYQLIEAIKKRCLKQGISITKSEILRAGLHALESLSGEVLREAMATLKKVKTGRPPLEE